jgi:hypothetical protein
MLPNLNFRLPAHSLVVYGVLVLSVLLNGALILTLILSSAKKQATKDIVRRVNGDVYIVTKADTVIKLPLVSIKLVKSDDLKLYIDRTYEVVRSAYRDSAEKWKHNEVDDVDTVDRNMKQSLALMDTPAEYLKQMSAVCSAVQTDSDGKYSMTLPILDANTKYYLLATAERSVSADVEEYAWLIPILDQATVSFNNTNLLTMDEVTAIKQNGISN